MTLRAPVRSIDFNYRKKILKKNFKWLQNVCFFYSRVFQNSLFYAFGYRTIWNTTQYNTGIRRLTMAIRSEKCVVRRFRRCANVLECTYTNLLHTYAIWYSLLLLDYKPVQHVTLLNTVGNCNTMQSIIILCYIIETFLLPTDAHNVKKHRVIKTF